MAFKRLHDEVDGASPGHQQDSAGGDSGPSTKRFKAGGKSRHRAKEGTIEYAKKRSRAIERLFQKKADLPAQVRNDLERELATHKATVYDKSFQKKRSAMISKYHMVRFFGMPFRYRSRMEEEGRLEDDEGVPHETNIAGTERKKAMRLAKQVKKKIAETTDAQELEKLRSQLHVAEVDEAYAVNHPHTEPYISIYGKSEKKDGNDADDNDKDDEATAPTTTTSTLTKISLDATQRPPLWSTVEKAMKDGPDALRRLRERRPEMEATATAGGKQDKNNRNSNSNDNNKRKKNQARGANATPKPTRPDGKAASAVGANTQAATTSNGKTPPAQMNRRERRRLMRETEAKKDEDDGEGFFDM
ncbi:Uncharacterized conserved protein (DUF2361) [Geosmithia morbida]|uniref:rRNA-processing protein EFG1 n=1 Tax=Geosmithia morbida TaxID=1094350 RepID=A0A9P4YYR3_9HYPO|nr:Uncharacterized conserved protein (DUF2361) [Geosmithia morbida]KAF4124211.1 Uncharacterized conserved protein (DUF2361) [Geosmithia morbida]